MHKQLTTSSNGHVAHFNTGSDRKKIYLICDRRDLLDAEPIIGYLHERGYEVVLPEFEETEADAALTDVHQRNLLECDGVIVYYGHANQRWVSFKKADLEKHPGLEKTVDGVGVKPLLAKAFYVTLPETDFKKVFNTHSADVIKNFGPFKPALLEEFIEQIEGGQGNTEGGDDNAE